MCPRNNQDEERAFAPPRAYTPAEKAGGVLQNSILLVPLLGSDADVLIPTSTMTSTEVVLQGWANISTDPTIFFFSASK